MSHRLLRLKSDATPLRFPQLGNAHQDTTEPRRDSESCRAVTVGQFPTFEPNGKLLSLSWVNFNQL